MKFEFIPLCCPLAAPCITHILLCLVSAGWNRNFINKTNQVLSMSRLGGAGAVAQLVADVPPSSIEVSKK